MAACMQHRGPDGEGILANDSRAPGVALAMRRLDRTDPQIDRRSFADWLADYRQDAQTVAAQRVDAPGGESGWRLTRRGGGHCDATYAAAGACHLARMAPEPVRTTMRAQIY